MTLRSRVIAGLSVAFALIVVVAVALGVSQRNQLLGQLDDRLQAVAPFGANPPGQARTPIDAPQPPPEQNGESPISDIYLAELAADGSISVVSQGQLLDDSPDIGELGGSNVTEREFLTVDSTSGSTSFRVLISPSPTGNESTIVAIPTTDVDATVRQLTFTLAGVAFLIGVALAAVASWVLRLGVRPITEMTETAQAIASGERSQRAPQLSEATEAGQLAAALNTMLDQRDEADDSLRQFVSDASHELRTPLTSISGYLEIYSQGGFREEGQLDDVVRRMKDEAERMTDLVENLLALARNDEGQPLDRTSVDIGDLITDIAADFQSSKSFDRLSYNVPDHGGLVAEVDRNKIKQLIVGLVDNAIIHAPGASVNITAESAEAGTVITVSDDGPGMSEQEAAKAFDRFSRGDPARTRTTGGSGLGLAIAESLARAHGGSISLTTSPGRGCSFAVELPNSLS